MNIRWPLGLIAVSITGKTVDACLSQMEQGEKQGADVFELRLDLMPSECQKQILMEVTRRAGNDPSLKYILTYRRASHGGPETVSDEISNSFWIKVFSTFPEAVARAFLIDWEFELVLSLREKQKISGTTIPWERIMVSRHDMKSTPDYLTLCRWLTEMALLPSGPMKIACMSNSAEDNERIVDLFRRNITNKPLVAIGMGPIGMETRLGWHRYGALLTFGRLEGHAVSAPGQPKVSLLATIRDPHRNTA